MEIKFYTQPKTATNEIINKLFETNDDISIAVAYLSAEGLKEIEQNVVFNKNVRILCGIHGCISDLDALKNLVHRSYHKIEGHVFIGTELFHPKIYIFKNDDEVSLIVGSPNLTAGGLKNNEESFVLIKGYIADLEMKSAKNYFEDLWCKRSISVDYYLSQHPEYSKKELHQNKLTNTQVKIIKNLEPIIRENNILKFQKKVKKELKNNGRVTIPKRFDQILNNLNYCPKGESRKILVISPDGSKYPGTFFHSHNNKQKTYFYYQFYLSKASDKEKLKEYINESSFLNFEFNLLNHNIHIHT